VSRGRVVRIGIKERRNGERGLPKREVVSVRLTRSGLEGDFNRYRHEVARDDLGMAVLLLPLETIRDLQGEGWPVQPGDLGENFTVEGLPDGALTAGRQYRLGAEATVELTKPCTPCDNLVLLPYVGAAREREFLRTLIDRRGFYARVLGPGLVRRDDAVVPIDPTPERSPSPA
jgi:MOSC domain-containing protein YiiM